MNLLQCSILLLAGGRGQRMGGQDKGLVMWRGEPLISHVQRVARPFTDDLIISCNRNREQYALYADHVISDGNDHFDGPLAGIRAGLSVAKHSHLLVLLCDVPGVDSALLTALLHVASASPTVPAMVRHGRYWEPLLCVIPVARAAEIEAAWQSGERSPRHILLELNAQTVQCAENEPRLNNFNTPQTLN